MRGPEVATIVENDTRTERFGPFTASRPQRVGYMQAEETDAVMADGFTPIRQHRKADLLQQATTAIAEVVASCVKSIAAARFNGIEATVSATRTGRRILLRSDTRSDAYQTMRATRAKKGAHPSDLPKIHPVALRNEIHPDHRRSSLPTVRSLENIATSSSDAEQFVVLHHGDPTYRIPKEPLRSMR